MFGPAQNAVLVLAAIPPRRRSSRPSVGPARFWRQGPAGPIERAACGPDGPFTAEPQGTRQGPGTLAAWRQDPAGHLAEADPGAVPAGRAGADRHLVAVLQKRARSAVGQRERIPAAPAQLDQRAALVCSRTAYGAGGE